MRTWSLQTLRWTRTRSELPLCAGNENPGTPFWTRSIPGLPGCPKLFVDDCWRRLSCRYRALQSRWSVDYRNNPRATRRITGISAVLRSHNPLRRRGGACNLSAWVKRRTLPAPEGFDLERLEIRALRHVPWR